MPPRLHPRTARELAYRVLEQHRTTGAWVQEQLATAFAEGNWSAADRGLITELVNGVVRRRATLDALLGAVTTRPLSQVEPPLLTLLHLGAYQVVFLDRVPSFAAVHETVELTKVLGQRRWTGIVNGVLRGMTRLVTDEWTDSPARDAVPVAEGRSRRLAQSVFADPSAEPVQFLAQAYSLPEWLAARWHARWPWSELLAVAEAINTPPVLFVRVNLQRTTPAALLARWQEAGINATTIDNLPALRLDSAGPIELLPGYAEGWFAPQDVTAMRAALLLSPQPGERVWDVCAAPGAKAAHLAELVGETGSVLATDDDPVRLPRVMENAQRLGLPNLRAQLVASDGSNWPAGPFDAVLLDAPCSNTGVLHRRPEVRWRIQPYDLGELVSLQRRLLHAALDRVKPGGRLVYSTCSMEPEENEQVVETVLRQRHDSTLVAAHEYRSGSSGDGGYQALLHLASRERKRPVSARAHA
jgi:16S rRNA (cytosine967-C5)-methyltransferase